MQITQQHCEAFLEQNKADLYQYIFKFFGSQDVVDDAFLLVGQRMYSLIRKKKISHDSAKTWLFAIAKKVCNRASSFTFQGRRKLAKVDVYQPGAVIQGAERLDSAVRSLPAEQRSAFLLYTLGNFTIQELGEVWQKEPAVVVKKLTRAIDSIAQFLGEPADEAAVDTRMAILYILDLCNAREQAHLEHVRSQKPALFEEETAFFKAVFSTYKASDRIDVEPVDLSKSAPRASALRFRWLLPIVLSSTATVLIVSLFFLNFYFYLFYQKKSFLLIPEPVKLRRSAMVFGSIDLVTRKILPGHDQLQSEGITQLEFGGFGLVRMGAGSRLGVKQNNVLGLKSGYFYLNEGDHGRLYNEVALLEAEKLRLSKKASILISITKKSIRMLILTGSATFSHKDKQANLGPNQLFQFKDEKLTIIGDTKKQMRRWVSRLDLFELDNNWQQVRFSTLWERNRLLMKFTRPDSPVAWEDKIFAQHSKETNRKAFRINRATGTRPGVGDFVQRKKYGKNVDIPIVKLLRMPELKEDPPEDVGDKEKT